MVKDFKKLLLGHLEKAFLVICLGLFVVVVVLQLLQNRENPGEAVEGYIKEIESARQSSGAPQKKTPEDYTKRMNEYWGVTYREKAQAYTETPFVIFPGSITEPLKELKALPPEKVTAVAAVGRNVVVVNLPLQQADLVHRANFEGKVLFKLYRKKPTDLDYSLVRAEPYEAMNTFKRYNYLIAILRDKLTAGKPLNPGDVDLALALKLIGPEEAEVLKRPKPVAPTPTPVVGPRRPRRTARGTTSQTGETWQERERRLAEEEDREREEAEARADRGYDARREQRTPSLKTVRLPMVIAPQVDLPEALTHPLTLEDANVEPNENYQYKVEVLLESPQKSSTAMSDASNIVRAISDTVFYLRGGTESFASIEVRKWLSEAEVWITKSFSVKPGEAIGYPVKMKLKDESGRFFVDAANNLLEREVDFSTGYTLVDLENREKFDPEKDLVKSPTLRMAYLNPKGGLEYKWTQRRTVAASAVSASQPRTTRRR